MITTLEDFTEVIEGTYNIKDIPSYVEYKRARDSRTGGVPQSEIDLMSPDAINSASFWEWIEKNPQLAKDAIGFNATPDVPIAEVNRKNFCLACQLGMVNNIMMFRDVPNMPLLDIGAGYGMLKEFVEKETKLKYYGVDVYPKVPGVLPLVDGDSTLPPEVMNEKFGLVVSTNVFQHLSIKQRRHYYEQIAKILHSGVGIFSVSMVCNEPNRPTCGFISQETKKSYMCHYGQYTEIQMINEVFEDLAKHFCIIAYLHRPGDYSFSFHCALKPMPTPPQQ
jgi:SAM-dependent methyltransferase